MVQIANASDLIYVPGAGRIYVSVTGNPGSLVPVDPVAASPSGAPIAVGTDPVKLARSDNGAFLYVGFSGQNSVQRVDLGSQAVSLTISLGSDTFNGPHFVEDIEVLPGSPQSIAVSRKFQGISPRHGGVVVFDDAVQRATATPGHTGSNVIEFSASAGVLYGYNNETTDFGFRTMSVDAGGVTITSNVPGLVNSFNTDIRFAGGTIFTTTGIWIDPVAGTQTRNLALPSPFGNLVVPDAALGRVFYLTNDGGWVIRAFSIATGQLLGSQPIVDDPTTIAINENLSGSPINMVRWGTNGLAFITDQGQLFIVASPDLIP